MESNLATPADIDRHQKRGFYDLPAPSEVIPKHPAYVGVWRIALGVFLGNLMFAVVAGLIYVMFTAH